MCVSIVIPNLCMLTVKTNHKGKTTMTSSSVKITKESAVICVFSVPPTWPPSYCHPKAL